MFQTAKTSVIATSISRAAFSEWFILESLYYSLVSCILKGDKTNNLYTIEE